MNTSYLYLMRFRKCLCDPSCKVTFFFLVLLLLSLLSSWSLSAQLHKKVIYDLHIQSGERVGHAYLTWKIRDYNASPIVVIRHVRPMSSFRLLNEGTRVSPDNLDSTTTSFVDEDVPPGAFYYAVLTENQVTLADETILRAGWNYTDTPFVAVQRGPTLGATLTSLDVQGVDELIAVNTTNSVILTWAPAVTHRYKEIVYDIYRSLSRLDTKAAFDDAVFLGTVRSKRPSFEDKKPIRSQDAYYAVLISGSLEDPKFKGLGLGRDYIKHRYEPSELSFPDNQLGLLSLTAKGEGSSVLLEWIPMQIQAQLRYRIYRSFEPLDTTKALRLAQLIGVTDLGVLKFRDSRPILDKDIYYGVIADDAVKKGGLVSLELNRSYVKYAAGTPRSLGAAETTKAPGQNSESALEGLEFILRKTYAKKNYKACITQIRKFLRYSRSPTPVEARARFFLGHCYYRSGKFSAAVKAFSHPVVRSTYPKRSFFWFERAAQEIR